jgi:hypothetical protein
MFVVLAWLWVWLHTPIVDPHPTNQRPPTRPPHSLSTPPPPLPPYPQVYNVGQKVVTRNTTGYIPSQIAFYLQNIHIEPRKIWLTRHAESLDQVRVLPSWWFVLGGVFVCVCVCVCVCVEGRERWREGGREAHTQGLFPPKASPQTPTHQPNPPNLSLPFLPPIPIPQVKHILGRDSGDLTESGRQYTILLTRFIQAQQERGMVEAGEGGNGPEVLVLAGTQQVGYWRFLLVFLGGGFRAVVCPDHQPTTTTNDNHPTIGAPRDDRAPAAPLPLRLHAPPQRVRDAPVRSILVLSLLVAYFIYTLLCMLQCHVTLEWSGGCPFASLLFSSLLFSFLISAHNKQTMRSIEPLTLITPPQNPHNNDDNRLRGGDMDGIDRTKLQELHPEVYEARLKDKLNYRYPGAGGESYADVIQRIRPIIVELERQRRSVLVVCHLAVQVCVCVCVV